MKTFSAWSLALVASALVVAETATAGGDITNTQICETAKERFFRDDAAIGIECNANYHHYNTGAVKKYYKKKKEHPVRIATFNMFHLGDNQTKFKDYAVVADIVNQWDVVAGTEVQPLPKLESELNEALAAYIAEFDAEAGLTTEDGREVTLERLYGDFIPTGYIRLLKELRKLDPSWALVLAAEGAGDGTHTELTGMFYRAKVAKPVATPVCGVGVIGCTSSYPASVRLAVERDPFLASFQAGNFDFTIMGVHLRFREPKQEGAMDLLRRIFDGSAFNIGTDEEVARFAELKTIADYMGRAAAASREKDMIIAGDFNLEASGRREAAWVHAIEGLPGSVVLLDTPTSVSKKNGLASEYDHFVLNPELTKECDTSSADSFNFLDKAEYPRISKELKRQSSRMDEYLEAAEASYKVQSGEYVPFFDADELKKLKSDFKRRMIDSQGTEANAYLAHMELISDHIPVSMNCSGSLKDDD